MCLVWRGAALATLAMLLGVVMLISGVVDIIIFCSARNVMYGAAWFLVDGILTVILSLFILFDQVFTMLTLPGIPVIYQGTEQAFTGYRDSMFAGGYREDGQQIDSFDSQSSMYQFIQQLAQLRHDNKVLSRGDLTILAEDKAGAGAFAYRRHLEDAEALVILNTASQPVLLNQMATSMSRSELRRALSLVIDRNAVAEAMGQDYISHQSILSDTILGWRNAPAGVLPKERTVKNAPIGGRSRCCRRVPWSSIPGETGKSAPNMSLKM
jgi:hypothetical protein